ncbi:MAG: hypothetical protein Q7J68_03220 [Thermoplasmata archaeon]|nr:hypothetical protein [Thermoplasmata archaeon]
MRSSHWWKAGDGLVSPILEMFYADALTGYRNLQKRTKKSRIYTGWSIVIMLTAFGSVVGLIAFISRSGEIEGFPLDLNDVLFLFFLVFMGKSLLDTYHYLVERPASVFLLIQPFGTWSIVLGKLLSIITFNLALLAFGLGTMTAMTFIHPFMYFVIPPDIVLNLILLSVLASVVGFTYAILSGLNSWPRKLIAGAAFSPVMSMIYLVMSQFRYSGWELTQTLGILAVLSLIGIPISALLLLESWNTMTGSRSPQHASRRGGKIGWGARLVRKYFGTATFSVYDTEVRTLLRKREGVGNAITLVGLLVFAIYFYDQFKDFLEFPGFFLDFIPILVVGLALYLSVVSLGLVPALGAFSHDGKSAWVYKTVPVMEREIVMGKALAVMLMLPFVVVCVAIPIPLVSGLTPVAMLFTGIGATVMFLTAVGIGIWHGAKAPNFDESSGNAPDVMTMYTFMLLILFLTTALLLPPLALAFSDKILGFLALLLSLDAAVLIFYLGIKGAAKGLANMELSN